MPTLQFAAPDAGGTTNLSIQASRYLARALLGIRPMQFRFRGARTGECPRSGDEKFEAQHDGEHQDGVAQLVRRDARREEASDENPGNAAEEQSFQDPAADRSKTEVEDGAHQCERSPKYQIRAHYLGRGEPGEVEKQ